MAANFLEVNENYQRALHQLLCLVEPVRIFEQLS
jgi:hypothetical protein